MSNKNASNKMTKTYITIKKKTENIKIKEYTYNIIYIQYNKYYNFT